MPSSRGPCRLSCRQTGMWCCGNGVVDADDPGLSPFGHAGRDGQVVGENIGCQAVGRTPRRRRSRLQVWRNRVGSRQNGSSVMSFIGRSRSKDAGSEPLALVEPARFRTTCQDFAPLVGVFNQARRWLSRTPPPGPSNIRANLHARLEGHCRSSGFGSAIDGRVREVPQRFLVNIESRRCNHTSHRCGNSQTAAGGYPLHMGVGKTISGAWPPSSKNSVRRPHRRPPDQQLLCRQPSIQ